MNLLTWQDNHNDSFDDDYTGIDRRIVSVYPYGAEDETVEYLVFGNVKTFRNLPCEAEITEMYRLEFDENGTKEISRIEVPWDQYPEYITQEAIRMLVEDI